MPLKMEEHLTEDTQAPLTMLFMMTSKNYLQIFNDYSTSELHWRALLLYYLLAQFCTHGPHTHSQQCRRTGPLFRIASTQSSVVQGREGTYYPLRTLPHSFEEQPSLIINRHTKRWASNNTEQIPLCTQVLNVSATSVCAPRHSLFFSDTCT